jgi:hypothetical protein
MYFAKFSTKLNCIITAEADTLEEATAEILAVENPPEFPIIEIPNAESMSQQQQSEYYINAVQSLETAGTIQPIDESLVH